MPESDGKRIVVIEDQIEVRENLIETLELAGYEVSGAADGHEGVKAVRQLCPNLVICDVMMPKLDGFGVLKLLQEDDATKHIPLVFLTAKAERDDLRRGMNLGAADYVTKPFLQDELLRVVELRLSASLSVKPQTEGRKPGFELLALRKCMNDLAQSGRSRRYEDRSPICFYEDSISSVYKVNSGRVRLYRETDFGKSLTFDTLGEDSWFGLGDALSDATYSFTAEAHPVATVQIVPVAAFRDLLERQPLVVNGIARQLAQDLVLRGQQLIQIAYFGVRKRVAELLLREAGEANNDIVLRREDIAESIASTPESVTRVLTEFKRDGLVELPSPGIVSITNPEKLREIPS